MDKLGVIILAGGNSSRFGKPKPFLEFSQGLTFIEKLVNEYEKFSCEKIAVVLNSELMNSFFELYPDNFRDKLNVISNTKPELGRFYSIKLGAEQLEDTDYCFIQNIDNPFTDFDTLSLLYNSRNTDSYISPYFEDKGGHPVLLPNMIIEKIKQETNLEINTKVFLRKFKKISVSVSNDKILANINTPVEYSMAFPRMRESNNKNLCN